MRRKAGRDVGRLFEARERAEIDSYFGLPPGRRQAEIDRRIQADEARRKAREAERSRRDEQGGGQRPTGQAQGGPPGPGTGGGATGNAPARGGRMVTEDDRNARSKSRIDRTSPDARARQTEYRRVIDERRKQLGLPPRPGRG
jgi:hypothetical protein